MSYAEGFEDAVELCMDELEKSETIKGLMERLRSILVIVKERKFDRLKILLDSR